MRELSIYVHFPFCTSRCHYCDFVSHACSEIPLREYNAAIYREWKSRLSLIKGTRIVSVYIGGGTPSLWPSGEISKLLDFFSPESGAEITVEVNPGDADVQWFEALHSAGVTRFSLGAQAFDDERLRFLERRHSVADTEKVVALARQAGAKAISLDLIFGTPGQSDQLLDTELDRLLRLGPEHVSAYELTVAKETQLGRLVREGRVRMPGEDDLKSKWQLIGQKLAAHGCRRYEVSSYAKPNHQSLHNMRYWQGRAYLALGLGAHGFVIDGHGRRHRYMNTKHLNEYLYFKCLDNPLEGVGAGGFSESITDAQHAVELLMLGLRTRMGVDLRRLEALLDESVFCAWQKKMAVLEARGLMKKIDRAVAPTTKGMIVADGLADFVIS